MILVTAWKLELEGVKMKKEETAGLLQANKKESHPSHW